MKTHIIEGNEYVSHEDGMTNCPSMDRCDIAAGETYERYAHRHAHDHGLDFPSQTSIDDIERNLTLYCGYYGHKYTIGNKTLCPYPFWETHEFVFNWKFHPDDLDMGMWERDERGLITEGCTFELKPFDDRLPGIYKRFKEVELPRGYQKTSTVSKAYVTISHLQQRFLFDNIYHRIIITSATTTLTEGVTLALKAVWERNQKIKKLWGVDRFKTRLAAGDEAYLECAEHGSTVVPMTQGSRKPPLCCGQARWERPSREAKSLLGRDGIYGSRTKNSLLLRWGRDAADATGLNAFHVLYAGIKTETQGQRADEQIFDDGNTKKNSRNQARREEVTDCFVEQVNQLDPTGRFMACNTRQHFDDFGGKIKTAKYRSLFHIMHRRAWRDGPDGERIPLYPKDGLGRERYSLRVLDEMRALKPEHEFWAEFMNCPLDPKRQLFTQTDFQIIDINDARVPIEISAGIGRPITPEQQGLLDRKSARVYAINACDPAGREEQSIRGDDTFAIGVRFDMVGNIWITWLDCGQWGSDEVWDHLFTGYMRNRPFITDYEKPANELHLRAAFEAWKGRKSASLGGQPIMMLLDLQPMPKSGKAGRIEQLTGWTRNKKVFVLADAGSAEVMKKFVSQHVGYPMETHDDGPDVFSRVLRFAQPLTAAQAEKALAEYQPKVSIEDGVMKVTTKDFLAAFDHSPSGALNWGLQGGKRRVA